MTHPIISDQIVTITGNNGTGKTFLAISAATSPDQISIINDDIKPPPKADYKYFSNIRDGTIGLLPHQAFEHVIEQVIPEIPDSEIIIWDNWARFGRWCSDYVFMYPGKFRAKFSDHGGIATGEKWRESRSLEGDYISLLKSKCDTLFITCQTKNLALAGETVPGARTPEISRTLHQASNIILWLTYDKNGEDIPTAVTLKNTGKIEFTNSGAKPVKILPKRLEQCNWDILNHYWDNPYGLQPIPEPHQIPDEFEESLISGSLTDEQRRLWQLSMDNKDAVDNFAQPDPIVEHIKTAIDENGISGPPVIMLKKVQEIEGLEDVTIEQLQEAIK